MNIHLAQISQVQDFQESEMLLNMLVYNQKKRSPSPVVRDDKNTLENPC